MEQKYILAIILVISVIGAIVSYRIYKKKKEEEEKQAKTATLAGSTSYSYSSTSTEPVNDKAGLWFFALFLIIILLVIGFSIYENVMRYKIAAKAIEKGDSAVGIAALTPEISRGLNFLGQGASPLFKIY
jgi:hypothetical protein